MHTYTSETHPFTYSSRIEVSIRSHRKIQTDPLWSLYGNAKLLLEVADLGFAGGVVLISDLHLGSQEAVESIRIVGNMWGKKNKMKKYMDLDDPKTMFNYELFYQIWCFTTKIKFLTNLVVRVPTSVHIIGLEVGPYWSLWPGVSNSGSKLHANFAGKHDMSMYSTQTSRVFHANSFQPGSCETCIYIYINTYM